MAGRKPDPFKKSPGGRVGFHTKSFEDVKRERAEEFKNPKKKSAFENFKVR